MHDAAGRPSPGEAENHGVASLGGDAGRAQGVVSRFVKQEMVEGPPASTDQSRPEKRKTGGWVQEGPKIGRSGRGKSL